MNEYRKYDSDLHYDTEKYEQARTSKNTSYKTVNKAALVIMTAAATVVLCVVIFAALTGHIYSSFVHISKGNNTDNERQKHLLTEEDNGEENTEITAEKLLENVVNVSVNVTGGFLNKTATISSGNGVFIRDGGFVLTSAYLLESQGNVTVTLSDGTEYKASLLGTDNEKYISVLKIDNETAGAAAVGNSDEMMVGSKVIGIGNKIADSFSNPITFGTVCGYDSDISLKDGTLVNAFQTDAPTLSGSIGGLMFNYRGELVGICTAKYAASSDVIGLVMPINDVIDVVNSIIDNTYVENTKKLGISATDADYGVTIDNVQKNSSADKAGLKHGDLIIKINGEPVSTLAQIIKKKNSLESGSEMVFTVYRNGETLDLTVVLE